ncbi:hypothetical protein NEOLI_002020 [Neolecta irregularis DAH-3]|uniref:Uncharacterized protein n=1 Tax=Neolecta irregularis (strain DAH-3) TaxID=1198029 RepID=A0A1U7LTN0_NEOID|nr:hypothetical protein NEOLI_002020 [Neolecta irregularis DAH-3]|eukprot:OLL25902.1 hypothetical protein NEOLI_002020 [Neolecta irregularis DAH-3]
MNRFSDIPSRPKAALLDQSTMQKCSTPTKDTTSASHHRRRQLSLDSAPHRYTDSTDRAYSLHLTSPFFSYHSHKMPFHDPKSHLAHKYCQTENPVNFSKPVGKIAYSPTMVSAKDRSDSDTDSTVRDKDIGDHGSSRCHANRLRNSTRGNYVIADTETGQVVPPTRASSVPDNSRTQSRGRSSESSGYGVDQQRSPTWRAKPEQPPYASNVRGSSAGTRKLAESGLRSSGTSGYRTNTSSGIQQCNSDQQSSFQLPPFSKGTCDFKPPFDDSLLSTGNREPSRARTSNISNNINESSFQSNYPYWREIVYDTSDPNNVNVYRRHSSLAMPNKQKAKAKPSRSSKAATITLQSRSAAPKPDDILVLEKGIYPPGEAPKYGTVIGHTGKSIRLPIVEVTPLPSPFANASKQLGKLPWRKTEDLTPALGGTIVTGVKTILNANGIHILGNPFSKSQISKSTLNHDLNEPRKFRHQHKMSSCRHDSSIETDIPPTSTQLDTPKVHRPSVMTPPPSASRDGYADFRLPMTKARRSAISSGMITPPTSPINATSNKYDVDRKVFSAYKTSSGRIHFDDQDAENRAGSWLQRLDHAVEGGF